MNRYTTTLSALLLLAGNAGAQDALERATLSGGWLAEELLGHSVYGINGNLLGTIENLLINADGQLAAVVVEAGGLLDLGDTHFKVPHAQFNIDADLEQPTVFVTESMLDDFEIFNDETITTADGQWRVTDLLGDFVNLEGGERYGLIDDLLFSREGRLQGVVIAPDSGGDTRYALPYATGSYDPAADTQFLAYGPQDTARFEPFDPAALR